MPRRKLEKAHACQSQPPPVKSVGDTDGNNKLLVEEQDHIPAAYIEVSVTCDGAANGTYSDATRIGSASPDDETRVDEKEGQCSQEVISTKDEQSRQASDPPVDTKRSHSLEALFQAADSELQHFGGTDYVVVYPNGQQVPIKDSSISLKTTSADALASPAAATPFRRTASCEENRLSAAADIVPGNDSMLIIIQNDVFQTSQTLEEEKLKEEGEGSSEITDDMRSSNVSVSNLVRSGHKSKHSSKSSKYTSMYKPFKYVCTYCGRGCAKPSVLQKHIRTHTGERPYPCEECGFNFKTKSNLYKHCKSRSHLTKADPGSLMLQSSSDVDRIDSSDREVFQMEDKVEIMRKDKTENELQPTPEIAANRSNLPQPLHLSSLGLKLPSCDSQPLINRMLTMPPNPPVLSLAMSHSLSLPESNTDKSVSVCSLLQLADGSVYLVEKLSNGQASLRPIQEITQSFANQAEMVVSQSEVLKPNALNISTPERRLPINKSHSTDESQQLQVISNTNTKNNNTSHGLSAGVNPFATTFESVSSHHHPSQMPKTLLKSSSTNLAMASSPIANAAAAAHPALRSLSLASAQSVMVAHKMAPIDPKNMTPEAVQERIAMLISQNESIIDTPMADAPRPKRVWRGNSEAIAASSARTDMSAMPSNKPLLRTKSLTPVTGRTATSLKASAVRGSNLPQPMATAAAAHVLSDVVYSDWTMSKKGKMESMNTGDPKNVTLDAVQERIAMLVSQNATSSTKCSSSKFLMVPEDRSLQDLRSSIHPEIKQLQLTTPAETRSENTLTVHKQQIQMKAKSLDFLSTTDNAGRVLFSTKDPCLITPSSFLATTGQSLKVLPVWKNDFNVENRALSFCQTRNSLHGKDQISNIAFHLPMTPVPSLFVNTSAADSNRFEGETQTVVKDVFEKRQEFARSHLVVESEPRTQSPSQFATNHIVNETCFMNSFSPSVPMQYLIIPADTNNQMLTTLIPMTSSSQSSIIPILEPPVVSPKTFDCNPQTPLSVVQVIMKPQPMQQRGQSKGTTTKSAKTTLIQCQVSTASSVVVTSPFGAIPSICVTPADAVQQQQTAPPTSEPLWKMKLKGRLLMKRSMSIEKVLAEEREMSLMSKYQSVDKCSTSAEIARALADVGILQDSVGLQRSHSCDAAMPLKKRRKTLTELGRGTAFGTRVEEANEALNKKDAIVINDVQNVRVENIADGNHMLGHVIQDLNMSKVSVNDIPINQSRELHVPSSLFLSLLPNDEASSVHLAGKKIPGLLMSRINKHRDNLEDSKSNNYSSEERELRHVSINHCQPEKTSYSEVPTSSLHSIPNAVVLQKSQSDTNENIKINVNSRNLAQNQNDSLTTQENINSDLMLPSHRYPSLSSTMSTTFCSVAKRHPLAKHQEQSSLSGSVCSDAVDVSLQSALSLYQLSRVPSQHLYAVSNISEPKSGVLTHSSYWNFKRVRERKSRDDSTIISEEEQMPEKDDCNLLQKPDTVKATEISLQEIHNLSDGSVASVAENAKPSVKILSSPLVAKSANKLRRIEIFPGGYKSNEDYVYIRGRGKGKYICEACGIRCKKPSMLKKHIRTHTDIRPHQCDICNFGFKTKGNLSKHIKSKAHLTRCFDLGIAPALQGTTSLSSNESSFDSQPQASNSREKSEVNEMDCLNDDDEEDSDDGENDEEDNDEYDENEDGDIEADDIKISSHLHNKNGNVELSETKNKKSNKNDHLNTAVEVATVEDSTANDEVRAATDSEAAASLLDLSKGKATTNTNLSKNIDEAGQNIISIATLTDKHETLLSSVIADNKINEIGNVDECGRRNIPLRIGGFFPSFFISQNTSPTSFQKSSPVFVFVSAANSISQSSSDPTNANRVEPNQLLFEISTSSVDQQQQHSATTSSFHVNQTTSPEIPPSPPLATSAAVSEVSGTNLILLPISSQANLGLTSGDSTVSVMSKQRTTCDMVPVPGKVSGDADECIDGKYVCSICRKSFGKQHQLALHKNIHYLERPFRCSDCGMSFQNRMLLERHERSEKHTAKTDNPRPFKCDDCGVAFRIHGHLAKHLRSKVHRAKDHSKSPSSSGGCAEDKESEENVMDGSSSSQPSEEQAVKSSSGGIDPLSSNALDEEMDTSTGSVLLSQESIQNQKSLILMSTSNQISTKVNFLESIRKNMTDSYLLQQREVGVLKCGICMKAFQEALLFEKHVNSHIELRPYICDVCDAGFTSRQQLDSHVKTHRQTKEHHICGMCGDILTTKQENCKSTTVACCQESNETISTLSSNTIHSVNPMTTLLLENMIKTSSLNLCHSESSTCMLPSTSVHNREPRFVIFDKPLASHIVDRGSLSSPRFSDSLSFVKLIHPQNILTVANSDSAVLQRCITPSSSSQPRGTATLENIGSNSSKYDSINKQWQSNDLMHAGRSTISRPSSDKIAVMLHSQSLQDETMENKANCNFIVVSAPESTLNRTIPVSVELVAMDSLELV